MKLDMEDSLVLGPPPRTCSETISHWSSVMTVTRLLWSITVVWRPHPLLSFFLYAIVSATIWFLLLRPSAYLFSGLLCLLGSL